MHRGAFNGVRNGFSWPTSEHTGPHPVWLRTTFEVLPLHWRTIPCICSEPIQKLLNSIRRHAVEKCTFLEKLCAIRILGNSIWPVTTRSFASRPEPCLHGLFSEFAESWQAWERPANLRIIAAESIAYSSGSCAHEFTVTSSELLLLERFVDDLWLLTSRNAPHDLEFPPAGDAHIFPQLPETEKRCVGIWYNVFGLTGCCAGSSAIRVTSRFTQLCSLERQTLCIWLNTVRDINFDLGLRAYGFPIVAAKPSQAKTINSGIWHNIFGLQSYSP